MHTLLLSSDQHTNSVINIWSHDVGKYIILYIIVNTE